MSCVFSLEQEKAESWSCFWQAADRVEKRFLTGIGIAACASAALSMMDLPA